jgi:hypothetical protein
MPNTGENTPDNQPDAKFVGLWEVHLKALNSLLIAHGAGLVTCLTLLKDYDANPRLKGIGWFITLFASGLVLAIAAYLYITLHRAETTLVNKPWFRGSHWYSGILIALLSVSCLMIALTIAAFKFGKL